MDIDWKILIAQIINFAILFFILKKFLYRPFFDLLEQRRKKIQAGIDNTIKADEKLSKLRKIKVNMEKQNERDRVSILVKAQSEGKKRKNQIIKDAEDEKMAILAKAKKEAEDIKQREADLTKKRIIDNAILLTEELLKENIDKDKGKKISEDFLSKIKI